MFTIHVAGLGRRGFEGSRVEIGRSTRCALVLPSPEVSRRHAVIEETADGFEIEDCGSGHGTFVDGLRITRAAITRDSRIRIGPFELTLEPGTGVDPVEARLLAAVTKEHDPASRLVYADWLEQRGDGVRAEFLRLQESLVAVSADELMDDAVIARTERMRELAASIDMGWRYQVARPAVEGCETRFTFQCPREWSAMEETEREDVRHCSACNKSVYYTATVERARRHVEAGACVVVDILPRRRHGDLAPDPEPIRMGGAIAMPSDYGSGGYLGRSSTGGPLTLLYNGRRYPVTEDMFTIGGSTCDLALAGEPPGTQRAVVIRRIGISYLKDVGDGIEFRGMRIDNKRIDEGDVFYIDDHELRFTFRSA